MLRTASLIILAVALLTAACGGSSNDTAVREAGDADGSLSLGPDGIYYRDDDDSDGGVGPDDVDAIGGDFVFGGGLGDNAVLGAMNPFAFLSGPAAFPAGQGSVDDDLGAPLLTEADVPGSYRNVGEFTMTVPSEFGDITMAARMFGENGFLDDVGAMIMSAVMALPPDAMSELDDLTNFTDADLAEFHAAAEEFAFFGELSLLNAEGLGDGGFGMRMEMDFSVFFEAFGLPEDDTMPAGMVMEMYAFAVGDRGFMLMVMSPAGESPGVDARALAEIMASRA